MLMDKYTDKAAVTSYFHIAFGSVAEGCIRIPWPLLKYIYIRFLFGLWDNAKKTPAFFYWCFA